MSRWWIWKRINIYWKLKQWKVDEIISRGKGIINNLNIDEINEGDERHYKIGGNYYYSIEESESSSGADYVNNNDENLVSGFDESTF